MRALWDRFTLWFFCFRSLATITTAAARMEEDIRANERNARERAAILDQKLDDLREPIKSYGDAIGGFSRDLQIIRDQIKREWKIDPKVAEVFNTAQSAHIMSDRAHSGFLPICWSA